MMRRVGREELEKIFTVMRSLTDIEEEATQICSNTYVCAAGHTFPGGRMMVGSNECPEPGCGNPVELIKKGDPSTI